MYLIFSYLIDNENHSAADISINGIRYSTLHQSNRLLVKEI